MQKYNDIDQKIHQLAQTIAKFNRSYASKKPDDSHTNLAFDPVSNRLLGRWVKTPNDKVIMALDLMNLEFSIFDQSWNVLFAIKIVGTTQDNVEKAIADFIVTIGLDTDGFNSPLHYVIPNYDFKNSAYTLLPKADLENWLKYRSIANNASTTLLNHLQIEAEVRIWPHHFDTGVYLEATHNVGLGFGLAMKDSLLGAPYYYLSGYGLNGHAIDYTKAKNTSLITWITGEHWNGATIPLESATAQVLNDYLKETTNWYLK